MSVRRLIVLACLALYTFVACGGVFVCVESDGRTNVEWALASPCCDETTTPGANDPSLRDRNCAGCNDVLASVSAARPRDAKTAIPSAALAPALEVVDFTPVSTSSDTTWTVAERAVDPPLARRPAVLRF